ncbi:MAG: hypothetical protein U1F34_08420 [Gammaproteobacteria bacterium]
MTTPTLKMRTGAVLATTAAMLFAMAPLTASAADEATVHCMSVNSCKGKGACKTANNACKGQNACKGMGWETTTTEKECTDKGGTVMK